MLKKTKIYCLSLNILAVFMLIVAAAFALPTGNLPSTEDNTGYTFKWLSNSKAYRYVGNTGLIVNELDTNTVKLTDGSILIEAKGDCSVVMPMCTLYLKRGSLALCQADEDRDACSILLESGRLLLEKKYLKLWAGNRVWLSSSNTHPQSSKTPEKVGVRQVNTSVLGNIRLTTAEFSLVQTMQQNPLVFALMHSNDGNDQSLKNKLIKTAAILDMITPGHGRFYTGYY